MGYDYLLLFYIYYLLLCIYYYIRQPLNISEFRENNIVYYVDFNETGSAVC